MLSTINYLAIFKQMSMRKLKKFCKSYCKNSNIKVVLTSFNVGDKFNMKDPRPKSEVLRCILVCLTRP